MYIIKFKIFFKKHKKKHLKKINISLVLCPHCRFYPYINTKHTQRSYRTLNYIL